MTPNKLANSDRRPYINKIKQALIRVYNKFPKDSNEPCLTLSREILVKYSGEVERRFFDRYQTNPDYGVHGYKKYITICIEYFDKCVEGFPEDISYWQQGLRQYTSFPDEPVLVAGKKPPSTVVSDAANTTKPSSAVASESSNTTKPTAEEPVATKLSSLVVLDVSNPIKSAVEGPAALKPSSLVIPELCTASKPAFEEPAVEEPAVEEPVVPTPSLKSTTMPPPPTPKSATTAAPESPPSPIMTPCPKTRRSRTPCDFTRILTVAGEPSLFPQPAVMTPTEETFQDTTMTYSTPSSPVLEVPATPKASSSTLLLLPPTPTLGTVASPGLASPSPMKLVGTVSDELAVPKLSSASFFKPATFALPQLGLLGPAPQPPTLPQAAAVVASPEPPTLPTPVLTTIKSSSPVPDMPATVELSSGTTVATFAWPGLALPLRMKPVGTPTSGALAAPKLWYTPSFKAAIKASVEPTLPPATKASSPPAEVPATTKPTFAISSRAPPSPKPTFSMPKPSSTPSRKSAIITYLGPASQACASSSSPDGTAIPKPTFSISSRSPPKVKPAVTTSPGPASPTRMAPSTEASSSELDVPAVLELSSSTTEATPSSPTPAIEASPETAEPAGVKSSPDVPASLEVLSSTPSVSQSGPELAIVASPEPAEPAGVTPFTEVLSPSPGISASLEVSSSIPSLPPSSPEPAIVVSPEPADPAEPAEPAEPASVTPSRKLPSPSTAVRSSPNPKPATMATTGSTSTTTTTASPSRWLPLVGPKSSSSTPSPPPPSSKPATMASIEPASADSAASPPKPALRSFASILKMATAAAPDESVPALPEPPKLMFELPIRTKPTPAPDNGIKSIMALMMEEKAARAGEKVARADAEAKQTAMQEAILQRLIALEDTIKLNKEHVADEEAQAKKIAELAEKKAQDADKELSEREAKLAAREKEYKKEIEVLVAKEKKQRENAESLQVKLDTLIALQRQKAASKPAALPVEQQKPTPKPAATVAEVKVPVTEVSPVEEQMSAPKPIEPTPIEPKPTAVDATQPPIEAPHPISPPSSPTTSPKAAAKAAAKAVLHTRLAHLTALLPAKTSIFKHSALRGGRLCASVPGLKSPLFHPQLMTVLSVFNSVPSTQRAVHATQIIDLMTFGRDISVSTATKKGEGKGKDVAVVPYATLHPAVKAVALSFVDNLAKHIFNKRTAWRKFNVVHEHHRVVQYIKTINTHSGALATMQVELDKAEWGVRGHRWESVEALERDIREHRGCSAPSEILKKYYGVFEQYAKALEGLVESMPEGCEERMELEVFERWELEVLREGLEGACGRFGVKMFD
ncbi:hypothetical protein GMOD_00001573 [Pyrenophora seminiperda CCB06]|uniref:Uncharacterized protein n=1 Tax=Pyrenophora seminiperda CCB06 TaxID=1302712 RepID=A0A3M7LZK4_9PLEO|nr:hypothetical protein GMOD_00001573 [Pyrenophora seminiperda CCB06]